MSQSIDRLKEPSPAASEKRGGMRMVVGLFCLPLLYILSVGPAVSTCERLFGMMAELRLRLAMVLTMNLQLADSVLTTQTEK
jgi:hypothetical protein